jgi:hypothetical protein
MKKSNSTVMVRKIFKKVVPIVEHFRKKGRLDNIDIVDIIEMPIFTKLVIQTMAFTIRNEKKIFDDWEKTEIGKNLYEKITKYLMADTYVDGNDNNDSWSYGKECKELKILNILLKNKKPPLLQLPNASQIKKAVRAYAKELEACLGMTTDDTQQGNVDEHLDGSVPE